MTTPRQLAKRLEQQKAAKNERELLELAFRAIHGEKPDRASLNELSEWLNKHNPFFTMLEAGAFESAALLLLPASAVNLSLFSYGQGWAASFNDRSQTVGELGAKKEMARLIKTHPAWNELRGEPLVKYEKAIAEHWLEFISRGAKTAGLALAAVAVRSLDPKCCGLV